MTITLPVNPGLGSGARRQRREKRQMQDRTEEATEWTTKTPMLHHGADASQCCQQFDEPKTQKNLFFSCSPVPLPPTPDFLFRFIASYPEGTRRGGAYTGCSAVVRLFCPAIGARDELRAMPRCQTWIAALVSPPAQDHRQGKYTRTRGGGR